MPLDPLIHQETRLRLLTALHRNREAPFAELCRVLDLTPGNLGSHAGKLEDAGYIRSHHALVDMSFQVRYRITPEGSRAYTAYLCSLQELLGDTTAS